MELNVYNTHIEILPYKKDSYPNIENQYTITDSRTGNKKVLGYIIDNNILYLPRGTSISYLERILEVPAKYINNNDPCERLPDIEAVFSPRDEVQDDSIKFLTEDAKQLALNLSTGTGKTFVSAYAINQLKERAIIITPNETLKQQWMSTFKQMIGYRDKLMFNIKGTNDMYDILYRSKIITPIRVFFVNHQTLRGFLSAKGPYEFHQFFKKIRVGIKVYDESHMEFLNIMLIDFFTNTKRTWYLTATFDRSDKHEAECFKKAFSSVSTFGKIQSEELITPHVIYHNVIINSMIDMKNRARLMGYPGFNSHKYGRYALFDDPRECLYNSILTILKKTIECEGKVLILVPIINGVDLLVKKLRKDLPEKTCGAFHSKIPKDEKEDFVKKDIIVSTIKSCGTGRDIKGLRQVICAEPMASRILLEQTVGRLRPYGENIDTYYWDLVDRSIPAINWWHKARMSKIRKVKSVKKVIQLTM